MTIVNPFLSGHGAARYAAGRPYVHPLFMERLRPHLGRHALGADVACGTGLSSVALAEVVDEVRAFDASAAMLARAAPHPHVTYAQAAAEALPLPDGVLDVLTVCQAFHWFDRPRFLQEARRTLRPGGVLFVYDDFFAARMEGQPAFTDWVRTRYAERYPSPPRHRYDPEAALVEEAGFTLHEEEFHHAVPMTREALTRYLMTHSNTLAAADSGRETPQETRGWLETELAVFFLDGAPDEEERAVGFRGRIWRLEPAPR